MNLMGAHALIWGGGGEELTTDSKTPWSSVTILVDDIIEIAAVL